MRFEAASRQRLLGAQDPTAQCINGAPASVQAYINPTPSTVWVIQIGGASPGVGFCISAGACAQFVSCGRG